MEEDKKEKQRKTGNSNRRKGANFEREVAKKLRELGYTNCRTTREASRLLDSCKVDIFGIKLNLQLKNVQSKINYLKLIDEINEQIGKIYPKRLVYPTIVLHKQNRKTLVTMSLDDFYSLINNPYHINELTE